MHLECQFLAYARSSVLSGLMESLVSPTRSLWTALSHLAKSLALFVALSNLGPLSLCALLKFVAALLIA
jgi:hypothetical protein